MLKNIDRVDEVAEQAARPSSARIDVAFILQEMSSPNSISRTKHKHPVKRECSNEVILQVQNSLNP
jgi:hypothetical protein